MISFLSRSSPKLAVSRICSSISVRSVPPAVISDDGQDVSQFLRHTFAPGYCGTSETQFTTNGPRTIIAQLFLAFAVSWRLFFCGTCVNSDYFFTFSCIFSLFPFGLFYQCKARTLIILMAGAGDK
uniref:(northern house mosquito) hypothetical protein n=1 Tax=Culex pipiens TaxID=7175 RepID=A0A8D8AII6_CULPI